MQFYNVANQLMERLMWPSSLQTKKTKTKNFKFSVRIKWEALFLFFYGMIFKTFCVSVEKSPSDILNDMNTLTATAANVLIFRFIIFPLFE